jgi:hypothetical protein
MSYIFIAHVEEDAEVALKIALGLEEAGYKTWCYEVDSVPGPSYIVRTGESVAQSQAVVVVISPHSLGSSQVTKEIVRAHESSKPFIPILRDITHTEFQQRQPEWREAIGSATSIRIPQDGIEAVIPLIIEGARLLGIQPGVKANSERIGRIRKALDEIHSYPNKPQPGPSGEDEVLSSLRKEMFVANSAQELQRIIYKLEDYIVKYPHSTDARLLKDEINVAIRRTVAGLGPLSAKPRKAVMKPKSGRPLLITIASAIVIAIIVAVIFLTRGGNKDHDHGLTSNVTSTKPVATSSSAPSATAVPTSLTPGSTTTATQPPTPATTSSTPKTTTPTGTGSPTTIASTSTTPAPVLKPDLIIQDITWSPQKPSMGDDVTLTIIITNLGKAKTASSYVAYYIDGNFKDSISANSIDSGATAKVSFQWKAELGTHRIKAVADFNNVIDESDETNNAKEIDFPGALAPDFVIQDITWDHTQTQGLVYINAIIMNVGGHASAPQVYFYVDGVFYTGIALQSVPGGYEYYIISKANQGTHTVKVVVNPLNSIPESDYTNNSKTVTLTIS